MTMRAAARAAGLLLALVGFALSAEARAETIEWRNGRWFDGQGFVARTFYSVDGVLTETKPPGIASSVDLSGKFVVPPFGDAHHHGIDSAEGLDAKIARFVEHGIFYVKNPNVIPDLLTPEVRQRLNRPDSIDVVFSNGGLTASGGHPVKLTPASPRAACSRACGQRTWRTKPTS
jgi:hypothetical protein